MMNKGNCIYCGNLVNINRHADLLGGLTEYFCPSCGNYAIADESNYHMDKNLTASFLFYDHIIRKKYGQCMRFLGDNLQFNKCIGKLSGRRFRNVTDEVVENWRPKTFSEKIDMILLLISELSQYDGEYVSIQEIKQLFFCKDLGSTSSTSDSTVEEQYKYLLNYFADEKLLAYRDNAFMILPKGLARVDELQKNQVNNKNVFIAMKFGDETKELREQIRIGIESAGFIAIFMDEVEHNHQIVPEMLYQIKNSRFVIAELSHHNNGAYYEAGYALGLGKEVIHICNEEELKSGLHFDVVQINTIIYNSIGEIPTKLKKRIEATII